MGFIWLTLRSLVYSVPFTRLGWFTFKGRVSRPVSCRKGKLGLLRYRILWRCDVVPIWYYRSVLAKRLEGGIPVLSFPMLRLHPEAVVDYPASWNSCTFIQTPRASFGSKVI